MFGAAAIASLAVGGVILFRRRELTWALPLIAAGAVFAFQGHRFVAFMRYFEPIYPILAMAAGWGAVSLWAWAGKPNALPLGRLRRVPPEFWGWASMAGIFLLFIATVWWALAFQAVYSNPNPRIEASAWIDANIPKGSKLTNEIWDDSLPYILPGANYDDYVGIATTPYDTDSPEKVRELVYGHPDDNGNGGLINADYVILSSTVCAPRWHACRPNTRPPTATTSFSIAARLASSSWPNSRCIRRSSASRSTTRTPRSRSRSTTIRSCGSTRGDCVQLGQRDRAAG